MRRESIVFRFASAAQALLVAHFLCGGQWAAAANANAQAAARRAIVATTLGVDPALLENSAAFQAAQAATADGRRAAGLERLSQHVASPKQAVQRVRVANFTTAIEGRTKAARLAVAASKAKALGLSPEAARASLESVAPGFRLAATRVPKTPKL